jgi:hypothetical protein
MNYIEATHWRDAEGWRWPHFSAQEMACRGTGKIKIASELMDKLEALRATVGKPLRVNSGYRSPEYNATLEGAAPKSEHVQGRAVDISMAGHDPAEFYAAAKAIGFRGFGFYPEPHNNFMHLDIGAARTWGRPGAWGIDPRSGAKSLARKSGFGMSALSVTGETAQQIAYQAQMVSDISEWIRIGAAAIGAVGLLLILYSTLGGKK